MTDIVKIHKEVKKLRDFTGSDWGAVSIQFQGLSSLMGLKELSPQNTKVMIDFVMDEFKDFSFDEIQIAFRMNIAGKLPDSKGEKTKPYGSFNIDYVGTVLALYRTYRTKELRRINKAAPMPEKTQQQKDFELKSIMIEVFNELNEHYKKKITNFTFVNGVKYFGCLKYFDLIPDYKKRQPKLANELWLKAKEKTLNSFMGSLDNDSRKIISFLKDSKTPIRNELSEKVRVSTTNNYKGLIVSKCLEEYLEIFDNLGEAVDPDMLESKKE